MSKFFSKKGFGLIEVMAAAVVLGFLIVGLNMLQMGNRESILRIRTRDAANFVAQHILDSLGTIGINSLVLDKADNKKVLFNGDKDDSLLYKYDFEGKNTGKSSVEYTVKVTLNDDKGKEKEESTEFTKATYRKNASDAPSDKETNVYAKNLEANVSWKFRNSTQSIKMAKVVR
jgi:prepilin-type N-terminal cleavage/methylation domain-containing protein